MARVHKMRKVAATRNLSNNVGVSKPEMDVKEWSGLPRDPLSRIFSFLNPVDIILVVPFVCKYWGRIFLEHLFCKKNNNCLDFGPLRKEPFHFFFYMTGNCNERTLKLMKLLVAVLHAFALDGHNDGDDDTFRATPITEISFPAGLPFQDRHIVYLAKRCPELEYLFLPCARKITGIGISRATRYWSRMKNMLYGPFTWRRQPIIDQHFPRTIEEFGINCKNLVSLTLGGFYFHWQSSALIARNLKSLKALQLVYVTISKFGLQIFLSKCKKLDELFISHCATTNGEAINHAKEFNIIRHQEGRTIKWSSGLYPGQAGYCYTHKELLNIIWKPVGQRSWGADEFWNASVFTDDIV